MIGLNFYSSNAAVQFPNQFVQQFSQTPSDIAGQYGPTILRTPHEMIVDLIDRVSCSFAHNKLMIAQMFYSVKLKTGKEEVKGSVVERQFPSPLKGEVPLAQFYGPRKFPKNPKILVEGAKQ